MDGLAQACKTVDDIRWVLLSLKDCLMFQGFSTADFSVRLLIGKNKQKGCRPFVSLQAAIVELPVT